MKKILVLTPFFYPHVGGSEHYMEDLYVYIKEKNKDLAIDVLCYNTNNKKSEELYQGLNIFRIPCWTLLKDQFCFPKPLSLIKFLLDSRSEYDLIHCSTRFFDSSWWGIIFAKLTNKKIILTDHCASHPTSGSFFVRQIVKIVEFSVVYLTIQFFDKIFVENEKTKKFLKETFNVGSIVAYPGIRKVLINKNTRKVNQKIEVLYSGRIIKSKGINVLLEIARKNSDINFTFAGDGPMINDLKMDSADLKNVKILGNVSREEIVKLLSGTDIFAYPSWHSEGLPLSLLEAGSAGVAVLATNTGAISELITDGKTGILVEPKNGQKFEEGFNLLVNDQELRNRQGDNLQKFVSRNFSWEKASEQILNELNS